MSFLTTLLSMMEALLTKYKTLMRWLKTKVCLVISSDWKVNYWCLPIWILLIDKKAEPCKDQILQMLSTQIKGLAV